MVKIVIVVLLSLSVTHAMCETESDFQTEKQAVVSPTRPSPDRWPEGTVYFEIDAEFNSEYADLIRKSLGFFSWATGIVFVEDSNREDRLQIAKREISYCAATVGYRPKNNKMILDEEVCDIGNVLHELMHVVGFLHPHQRCDRDRFVTIYEDRVPEWLQEHNTFSPVCNSEFNYGEYDYYSILHYPSSDCRDILQTDMIVVRNCDIATERRWRSFDWQYVGQRSTLSPMDIYIVKLAYSPESITLEKEKIVQEYMSRQRQTMAYLLR
jgi:hypothetical protein